MLEGAKSEALCAMGVFEKFGAVEDMGDCIELLQEIEAKFLKMLMPPTPINSQYLAQ